MVQTPELTKAPKIAITNVLKGSQEQKGMMGKSWGNSSGEMETTKRNQMETMKLKLHYHKEDLIAGVNNRLESRVKCQ